MNFNYGYNFGMKTTTKLETKKTPEEQTDKVKDEKKSYSKIAPETVVLTGNASEILAAINKATVQGAGLTKEINGGKGDPLEEMSAWLDEIESTLNEAETLEDILEICNDLHVIKEALHNMNPSPESEIKKCAKLYAKAIENESIMTSDMSQGPSQNGGVMTFSDEEIAEFCEQVGHNCYNYDQYEFIFENQTATQNRQFFNLEVSRSGIVVKRLTQFFEFLQQKGNEALPNLLHNVQELLNAYVTRRALAQQYLEHVNGNKFVVSEGININHNDM